MGFFIVIAVVVGGAFWVSLGTYVGGRILLPEIGLQAPEYWTWFWYVMVGLVFYGPLYWIKEIFK